MSQTPVVAAPEPRLSGLIVVGIMVAALLLIVLLVALEAVPSEGYAAHATPETLITTRSFALADRNGRSRQVLQLEASGKQNIRVARMRLIVFDDRNGNGLADEDEQLFAQVREPEQAEAVLRIGPTTAEWDAKLSAPLLEYEVEFNNGRIERRQQRLRGTPL